MLDGLDENSLKIFSKEFFFRQKNNKDPPENGLCATWSNPAKIYTTKGDLVN